MEQNQVCVLMWVKFCENYPDIREVIKWICEKTEKQWLNKHLYDKFNDLYNLATCHGAMNLFYCEIDKDLREALVEYALTVWAPIGMKYTFEEKKSILGL